MTDDFADAGCEHFYAWSSPAGTRHGIGVCIYCHQPDPNELDRLMRGIEAFTEVMRRAARAADQLTLLMVNNTPSEQERLRSKLEGVQLIESYLSDEMGMLHERRG